MGQCKPDACSCWSAKQLYFPVVFSSVLTPGNNRALTTTSFSTASFGGGGKPVNTRTTVGLLCNCTPPHPHSRPEQTKESVQPSLSVSARQTKSALRTAAQRFLCVQRVVNLASGEDGGSIFTAYAIQRPSQRKDKVQFVEMSFE